MRSLGEEAQEVRTPAVLSSPCPHRCPVRASSVPRVAVQLSGVRCGCLSVQVSSVRPPASGVAVRCPCLQASAVADRNGRGAWQWGRQSCGWDGRGSAWSPGVSATARLPEVDRGARGWPRPCWASGGSARRGRRRGRWLGSGRFDRVVDRERLDARGSPVGRQPAATTLGGQCVRPGAESPGLGEPARLHCDVSLRPRRGRNMAASVAGSRLATL
jgi:hypothetical protein